MKDHATKRQQCPSPSRQHVFGAGVAPPPGLGFDRATWSAPRAPPPARTRDEAVRLLQMATNKARSCKRLQQRLRLSVLHNCFVADVQTALVPVTAPLETVFWPAAANPITRQQRPAQNTPSSCRSADKMESMSGVWAASPSDDLSAAVDAGHIGRQQTSPATCGELSRRPLQESNGRDDAQDIATMWRQGAKGERQEDRDAVDSIASLWQQRSDSEDASAASACARQLWGAMPSLDLQGAIGPRPTGQGGDSMDISPDAPASEADADATLEGSRPDLEAEVNAQPTTTPGSRGVHPLTAAAAQALADAEQQRESPHAPAHGQAQRKERRRTRRKSLELTCPRRRRAARSGVPAGDACGLVDRPRLIWRAPAFGLAC